LRARCSGRRFGLEKAPEAGAGKLHSDEIFAWAGLRTANVDDLALRREIRLLALASGLRERNMDLQIGSDGDIETCHEGGATTAQIFAGRFFHKADAAGIASADGERQTDGNAALGARTLRGSVRLNHANPQVLTIRRQVNRSAGDEAAGILRIS